MARGLQARRNGFILSIPYADYAEFADFADYFIYICSRDRFAVAAIGLL
jgi:hypothetical protein